MTTVDSFWHGMARGVMPIALLKQESSAGEWARIEAAAIKHVAGALPELPARLPATAYLATGRKP